MTNSTNVGDKEPKSRYTSEIQAMMYTFGDVRTPLTSSAQFIEQVVRKQLIELIIKAAHVAHDIRGARSIIPEDIIFVVRKDPVKVQRLKEFLQWRELRKQNSKPADEGASLTAVEPIEDDIPGITPIDVLSIDAGLLQIPSQIGVGKLGSTPSLPGGSGRRRTDRLPWDVVAGIVAEAGANVEGLEEGEEHWPEVEAEARGRLRRADEMTREMSREEYIEYAECRQASFTFKKAKKFRDWLNPAQYIDFRLNDDVVELLGFLAWDMVRRLTEAALSIRTGTRIVSTNGRSSSSISGSGGGGKTSGLSKSPSNDDLQSGIRCDLFESASEKTAITPDLLQKALIQLEKTHINPAHLLLSRDRSSSYALKLY